MAVKWITAYNTRTGKRLKRRVPETYLQIFKELSATPPAAAASEAASGEASASQTPARSGRSNRSDRRSDESASA